VTPALAETVAKGRDPSLGDLFRIGADQRSGTYERWPRVPGDPPEELVDLRAMEWMCDASDLSTDECRRLQLVRDVAERWFPTPIIPVVEG
jgi:hypothetical protein